VFRNLVSECCGVVLSKCLSNLLRSRILTEEDLSFRCRHTRAASESVEVSSLWTPIRDDIKIPFFLVDKDPDRH
jgi:hypothetical protein